MNFLEARVLSQNEPGFSIQSISTGEIFKGDVFYKPFSQLSDAILMDEYKRYEGPSTSVVQIKIVKRNSNSSWTIGYSSLSGPCSAINERIVELVFDKTGNIISAKLEELWTARKKQD